MLSIIACLLLCGVPSHKRREGDGGGVQVALRLDMLCPPNFSLQSCSACKLKKSPASCFNRVLRPCGRTTTKKAKTKRRRDEGGEARDFELSPLCQHNPARLHRSVTDERAVNMFMSLVTHCLVTAVVLYRYCTGTGTAQASTSSGALAFRTVHDCFPPWLLPAWQL